MGFLQRATAGAAAALALLACSLSAASADTVLWVHGAAFGEIPLSDVLLRVPPGYAYQEVDYPAGLWPWNGLDKTTAAESIATGVVNLDAAIRATLKQDPGRVLVIGESLGAMVVDEALRTLAGRPDAPDPARVSFQIVGDPSRPGGFLSYRPMGSIIRITGTRQQLEPVSQYDVSVVKLQYDGIASFPDRPWRPLAVINAIVGAAIYHGSENGHYGAAIQSLIRSMNATPGQVPPGFNVTTSRNTLGGVTTVYSVAQTPALLHGLEPVFPKTVAALNKFITAAINRGYSELTPDAGPHLIPGGRLAAAGATDQSQRRGSSSPRGAAGTSARR